MLKNLYILLDIRKSFYLINHYLYYNESTNIYYAEDGKDYKIYLESLKIGFPKIKFCSIKKIKKGDKYDKVIIDFVSLNEISNSTLNEIKYLKLIVLLNPNIGIYESQFSTFKNIEFVFWSKKLFKHLKDKRNSSLETSRVIFKNYFSNQPLINVDIFKVLIFMPSRMNFSDQSEYYKFLKNLRLKLTPFLGEKIFIKHHQANINSYSNANSKISLIAKTISFFSPFFLIEFLIKIVRNKKIYKFFLLLYLSKIEEKFNICKLPYPHINIEFYLHSADTLIGGFSNTLFFGSFFNKNIILLNDYIPDAILKQGEKFETKNFLKTNMEFFLTTEKKYFFSKNIFDNV